MKGGKILVEVGVEEMGYISLALDRGLRDASLNSPTPAFQEVQRKWDRLYRAVHTLPPDVKGVSLYEGGKA
jgi:hypothetical protein